MFKEVLDIAQQQILFVAIVLVEGRAADTGAIEDLLHSDLFESLFCINSSNTSPRVSRVRRTRRSVLLVAADPFPDIMRRAMRDTAENGPLWHIIAVAFFQINQAYAGIFTVAASAAVVLWSASALRHGGLGRAKAIYGCIASPLLMLGVASGHLRLDVHGMGLVALSQAIWFIPVGAELYAKPSIA